MPAKKVSMSAKMGARPPRPANLDDWVETPSPPDRSLATAGEVKMKRLTLDIPLSLHKAIKTRAVEEGVPMVNLLRELLQEHYGPD
jgi:predicted DNA binding CopG/RHH family protein